MVIKPENYVLLTRMRKIIESFMCVTIYSNRLRCMRIQVRCTTATTITQVRNDVWTKTYNLHMITRQ